MDLKDAKIVNYYSISAPRQGESEAAMLNVPFYQRPFTWEKSRVKALIDDLFSHKDNSDGKDNYFSGAMVTVLQDGKHDIIDGQQRTTTMFLANYLKFILMRSYLENAFFVRDFHAMSELGNFEKCVRYLFEDRQGHFKDLIGFIGSRLNDCLGSPEDEQKQSRLVAEFRDFLGLPNINQDDSNYSQNIRSLTEGLLSKNGIRLTYSRKQSNKYLVNSLSRASVRLSSSQGPTLVLFKEVPPDTSSSKDVLPDKSLTGVEELYLDAIEALFNGLMSRVDKNLGQNVSPSIRARSLISQINFFLKQVKFCVIQTGRIEDAYTLFEVLNDRSAPLGDLDIIKNMFYRGFVTSSGLSMDDIDECMESLDNQWSGIFHDATDGHKVNTLNLALTFFLGKGKFELEDFRGASGRRYRMMAKKYLSDYECYGKADIVDDFRLIASTSSFLDKCGFQSRKTTEAAMRALFDPNASHIKQAVTVLKALNLDGVLSGIVSPVLKRLAVVKQQDERIEFINNLALSQKAPFIAKEIDEVAYYLLRYALICDKYEMPLRLVNEYIVSSVCKYSATSMRGLIKIMRAAIMDRKQDFKEWTDSFSFNRTAHKLRIRLILSLLLKTGMKNGSDGSKTMMLGDNFHYSSAKPQKIHLDHLEPKSFEADDLQYFHHERRNEFVNGLGNMMLMDGKANIGKSNKPMCESFDALRKSGLSSHWLTAELEDMLKKHSDTNGGKLVPKESFFHARSLALQNEMFTLLTAKYGQKSAKVVAYV